MSREQDSHPCKRTDKTSWVSWSCLDYDDDLPRYGKTEPAPLPPLGQRLHNRAGVQMRVGAIRMSRFHLVIRRVSLLHRSIWLNFGKRFFFFFRVEQSLAHPSTLITMSRTSILQLHNLVEETWVKPNLFCSFLFCFIEKMCKWSWRKELTFGQCWWKCIFQVCVIAIVLVPPSWTHLNRWKCQRRACITPWATTSPTLKFSSVMLCLSQSEYFRWQMACFYVLQWKVP